MKPVFSKCRKISISLICSQFRGWKYTFFHNCKYVPHQISEVFTPNFVKCYMMIAKDLGMTPIFLMYWNISIWMIFSNCCAWKYTFFTIVNTTSNLRILQSEFHEMLHGDSLGPANDARLFEIFVLYIFFICVWMYHIISLEPWSWISSNLTGWFMMPIF